MTEPMHIQWYPGHMAKTRRQIEADLKQVDAVCEIVDARIPSASRNPDIDVICGGKPRMAALSRIDLADSGETRRWLDYFRRRGLAAIGVDLKRRKGIGDFQPALRELLAEKIARDTAKGMRRPLRVMVVGIPNVGKSTFINQISGRKGAKTENRPGVTVPIDAGIMPIMGKSQITRMVFLCGASLPSAVIRMVNRYEHDPDSLLKAGMEYAAKQIVELAASGAASGIHIYTMNKPEVARFEREALRHAGF